jgi:hypothetical protein
MGIGGTPEGVIAACALKCMGGTLQVGCLSLGAVTTAQHVIVHGTCIPLQLWVQQPVAQLWLLKLLRQCVHMSKHPFIAIGFTSVKPCVCPSLAVRLYVHLVSLPPCCPLLSQRQPLGRHLPVSTLRLPTPTLTTVS